MAYDANAISKKAAASKEKREEKEYTAGKIRERYNKGVDAVRGEMHQFWMNHSFIMGEQWVYWDDNLRSIAQVPRDPDRVRVTVNKMWPASRTVISKLTSRELQFEVPPSAADDATIRGAKTSEAILYDLHREHDWEGIREDANWYAWKGGTAAIAVEWDASAGQALGMTDSGKKVGTGDTVETALSITDFVVQPGVRNAEYAKWWIKGIAYPPETVKDMFHLKELPAADASAAMTPFQAKLMYQGKSRGDATLDLTLVLTMFERPNAEHPEGKVCTIVGDQIVDEAPWPFPFKDRLNFVIIKETRVGNRWTGETVVTMARSVQSALNQSWSSIIEHMKLAGNARMAVPAEAADMVDSMTDLPGEIILVPAGSIAPAYVSPPQMPSWWIDQPIRLQEQMDDIMGVHDASRGDAPVNIESGLGLSILIEQDATPVGRMSKENAYAFGRLSTLVLKIYEAKVKERRKAVVKTPGQPAESVQWTGKDLQGQTTVIVPTDSIVPRSKAAQQQFAKEALQSGLITTLPEFLKLSEIPGSKDYLEALHPDVSKARSENATMALGQVAVPEDFDDHNIHIQEHLTFMKSAKWGTLPTKDQDLFRKHNQAHATLSAEELGNAAAKAQQSPLLATAASATGGPVLPPEALGAAGGQAPLPAEGGAPPEGAVAGAVQEQFPNIPPEVVQQGI